MSELSLAHCGDSLKRLRSKKKKRHLGFVCLIFISKKECVLRTCGEMPIMSGVGSGVNLDAGNKSLFFCLLISGLQQQLLAHQP